MDHQEGMLAKDALLKAAMHVVSLYFVEPSADLDASAEVADEELLDAAREYADAYA